MSGTRTRECQTVIEGVIIIKTSAFHSKLSGVHHDNTSCTEGNNIESYNKLSGTGGKPLCDHCKRL